MSSESDTTGDDLSWHARSERPRWSVALRSPGVLWLLAFFVINCLALGLAMGVHGGGFDDCERMPTSSDRQAMATIAVAAVVLPAGLALLALRGRVRGASIVLVAFSAAAWAIVVGGGQSC